jgi:hypothetical protein
MGDITKTADTTKAVELTVGELRRLRARIASDRVEAESEMTNLGYGKTAIEKRLLELVGDTNQQAWALGRVDGAIKVAESLPRGRRVLLEAPWGYPKYNPHRRLAVMRRSIL